jgi:dolichol-phosphate mannosyltransferase
LKASPEQVAEFARYLVTGASCIALNVVIITALTEYAGFHYLLSVAVCFGTVTLVGFLVNRYWTFRKRGGVPLQDLRRYLLVTIGNMAASLVLCAFFVDVLNIRYYIAVVVVSIVLAPLSFILHRGWSFGFGWLRRPR